MANLWDRIRAAAMTDYERLLLSSVPRQIPSNQITWPSKRTFQVQIQQLKVAGQATALSNSFPSVNQVPSGNMPKHVANVAINRVSVNNGTQHQINVKFDRDPADAHYRQANVYLKQATGTSLVTSGKDSPLSFVTNATDAPSSVVIQTEGNWGANPLEHSPSRGIRLGGSTGGQANVSAGVAGTLFKPVATAPKPQAPSPNPIITGSATGTAGENLAGGAFIYIKASDGLLYNAVWTSGGNQAIGYVLVPTVAGLAVDYYSFGSNSALTGLTVGSRYYGNSATPGGVTATVPTGVGVLAQFLGEASSTSSLEATISDAIVLAT